MADYRIYMRENEEDVERLRRERDRESKSGRQEDLDDENE